MRHNFEKYQKRRRIREEWGRRLDTARTRGSDQGEYGRVVTEYWVVTQKIRRYYDWLRFFTGRMC